MSETTFADLGVSPRVVAALSDRGITAPFAIQALVVADALAGHDVLAKSPTGSGKTLAFGIPIVERTDAKGTGPTSLILVPTRELASQVTEEIRGIAFARGLRITAVYGGVSIANQARVAKRANILVATPGRLEDLVNRGMVRLDGVTTLVLDEADRMLDMGFQPQVDKLVARIPRNRQTMFFSATLEGATGRIADAYTTNPRRHESTPVEVQRAAIEHRFVSVSADMKVDALLSALTTPGRALALVFVRTKHGADRLVRKLEQAGVGAVAMHGDKTQSAREKALSRFESGRVNTLVATEVAARGIDVDGISHVINFDAPEDRDAYTHRVGRTGRAGRTGVGITFVAADQEPMVGKIAVELNLRDQFEAAGMQVRPERSGQGPRRRTGGRPPVARSFHGSADRSASGSRPAQGRRRPRAERP